MQSDGSYVRPPLKRGEVAHRSQMEFIALPWAEPALPKGKAKSKYPRVKLSPRPKNPAK